MSYSKNRKKNGIGREHRGRKPRWFDPRVQKIIDEVVDMSRPKKKKVEDSTLGHAISAPDTRFDHPDLYNSPKYTAADKIAAVTALMVTGNTNRASKYTGIPYQTLLKWQKTEWWLTLTQQVKKEKNDELDAQLTAVLHEATDAVMDRLKEGDTHYDTKQGTTYKMPIKGKDLAIITSALFDKRQLLRGDVTSRSEKVSTSDRLNKLKAQFEQFSNAKDISAEAEVVEDD